MKEKKTKRIVSHLLWILFLILFATVQIVAQTGVRKITGKISDKSTGEPVVGASISIKGTANTITSGNAGEFSIYAKTGESITISYIGFAPQVIKIDAATVNLKVALSVDYGKLNDVVVIGYGKMRKTDLSSSQVTVTSADMSRTVNTTLDQALEGRAANVQVSSSNAQPGSAPSVIIRGLNSLNQSNQPLYVIDGVQIRPSDSQGGAAGTYNAPTSYANPLSGINPDDIETMNVLQGPSATAIFGAAGGNGVIMITTKRGKIGETKVSLNSTWSMQDLPKFAPVMNLPQYAVFRNELQKAGGANSEADFNDPSVLGNGTNWQQALFNKTLMQKYVMALSGGNDKTNFYFSGEYFNQNGVVAGSGFSRGSLRVNLDNNTRKWLKIGTSLSMNLTNEKIVSSNNALITTAIDISPAIAVKNADGTWGGPAAGTAYANNFVNPIALAQINTNYNKGLGVLGGVYADITLMKGLVLHNEFNGTYNYTNNYQFNPTYTFGITVNNTATGSQQTSNNWWWGVNSRLQYDTKIKMHAISAMIGHEATAWGWESLYGYKTGFVNNTVQTLNAGVSDLTQSNSSSKGDASKESYFGRANYIYNDRYILQASYRRDGSSVFGSANRWGGFPSVSGAWKISEEKFMKNIPYLNDLKIRAEYGLSGNSGSTALAQYAVLSSYPSAFGTSFLPSGFYNPNVQWEVDKTENIGFDMHMFNSRLEVIFDYYQKYLSKLLISTTYPGYFGGGTAQGGLTWPVQNLANMYNHGFGLTVNTVNISKSAFTWKTGLSFSLDRNKVTSLPFPINVVYQTSSGNSQTQFLTQQGAPAGMITGYVYQGLFKNYQDITAHANQTSEINANVKVDPNTGTWVGDMKFKDINGDGKITAADRVVLGNPWPKYSFGFNNSFSYKGFDLNLFFTGSVGNDIVNVLRMQNELPGSKGAFENYYSSTSNFARPSSYNAADALTATLTNPNTNIPRVFTSTANGNNRLTQLDVEKGTYVKLKNISINYNVPAFIASKVAMKGLRVGLNIQNLLTFSKYKGFDPEVGPFNYYNSGNPTVISGIDNGRYPSVRMYTLNILANF